MKNAAPLFAFLLFCTPAAGAELHFIGGAATQHVVDELAEEFGHANGHTFDMSVGPMGTVRRLVEDDAPADIIIASTAVMEDFLAEGKVVAGSTVPIGHIGIGVAVREGAPAPAIGTVEEFKEAILNARAITHMDPAAGASSGIAVARTFKELGIADEVAGKTVLQSSGYSADRVVSGEADIALQNISELMAVDGVTVVGYLPEEIQTFTSYVVGVAAQSAHKAEAEAFVSYLTRSEADQVWRDAGIEPGAP
jgi:molybdate transport system substrate-binding protein